MDVTPAVVEVSIDRLVLDGVGHADVGAVRAALESGLERRLRAHGAPPLPSDRPVVAARVTWDRAAGAAGLGDALAASLYEEIIR